jgi:hypothetical protein
MLHGVDLTGLVGTISYTNPDPRSNDENAKPGVNPIPSRKQNRGYNLPHAETQNRVQTPAPAVTPIDHASIPMEDTMRMPV